MLEGWELNFSEGRTFLLPTHSAEVMMYSNCTTKGNVNLVFLLSLGTKGLGLWGILSDQLNHPTLTAEPWLGLATKIARAELETASWHPLELKVLQVLAASASWGRTLLPCHAQNQGESPLQFGSNSADGPAAHEASHGKLSCTEGSHLHCHHQD